MKNLKQNLIDFEINTVDRLLNYFITCYEYSFTSTLFKDCKVKPKDLFLGYAESLKDVEDLERLWYGLELKYCLFMVDEFPLTYLKNSINKTLKDINLIDIEVLKIQTESFTNVILDEGLKGLLLRPSLLIYEEDDIMFNSMVDTSESFYNFLDKYEKYIVVSKINKFRVLPAKITDEFVDKHNIALEIWALLVQGYFMESLYPTVQKALYGESEEFDDELELEIDEDDLIEMLENSNLGVSEIEDLTEEQLNQLYELIIGSKDDDFEDEEYDENEEDEFDEEELELDEENIKYVDININQDEILELTSSILGAIFKSNGISDEIAIKMFEELISININTLSNILSKNLSQI